MNIDQLLQNVVHDTLGRGGSLWAFRPELALCATIIAVLLARIVLPRWKSGAYYMTLLGLLTACYFAFPWQLAGLRGRSSPACWSPTLHRVLRGILLGFTVLFVTFTQMTGVWDRDDRPSSTCWSSARCWACA